MERILAGVGIDKRVGVVLGLWAGAVGVPLFVGGPQLFVGSIVNAMLVVASVRLSLRERMLMAILPSMAAVGHGVLFGGLTSFLVYLMPFIWVGNWLLMSIYRKYRKLVGVAGASVVKAIWLFGGAFLLNKLGVIPAGMVSLMGIAQLSTALLGGGVANWVVNKYGRS